MAQNRFITLSLPRDEYQRLARIARDQERDVVQQATYLLRQCLRVPTTLDQHSVGESATDRTTTSEGEHVAA